MENDKFVKLGQCEEPWFCLECMTNNLPFYALNEKKVKQMFNVPTKKLEKAIEGIPWCKICNRKNTYLSAAINCQHCNYLNHKKCSKNVKNTNSTCQECLAEAFPFARIDLDELLEISFNSNFNYKCLKTHKQNQTINASTKKLLNLQELSFNKNPKYVNSDPNANIADPMNFSYYETHALHKLKNNLKINKSENFSIFHSNICSLQGNFDKLEILLDN